MRLDDWQATAAHEAGHAIAMAVLGIPIREVVSGMHTGFVLPWSDDAAPPPEDIIITLLAGSRAAFNLGEVEEPAVAGGADDRMNAARIAYQLDPRSANATLDRLRWVTASLVIEHEAVIAAFANELLTHRRLAGDELQRALERAFMQSQGGPR
jgi:hypothetical protein